MKYLSLFFLILGFSLSTAFAQKKTLPFFQSTTISEKNAQLDSAFFSAKIITIETSALKNMLSSGLNSNIEIQFDDLEWTLNIESANIAPIGVTQSSLSLTEKATIYDPSFKGFTQENKPFRLTINDNFIAGFLPLGDKEYFIEPLHNIDGSAEEGLFVFYEKKQLRPQKAKTCLVKDVENQLLTKNFEHSERSAAGCAIVDLAIATDASMDKKYGSSSSVSNRVISIMNLVEEVYKGSFSYDIKFNIVKWFHSSSNDPWTSGTDAGAVLESFSQWGVAGGFGVTYDLGQFWTARDFSSTTIGIAWLNGVCSGKFKHHAIQDFSTNDAYMRCLVAHEIGHNFSMSHNSEIMAPSVSTSSKWSNTSVQQIDAYLPSVIKPSCIALCSNSGGGGGGNPSLAPIPEFSYVPGDTVCINRQIQFEDNSKNTPSSYKWSFQGGTPSTSTLSNPKVLFKASGSYFITLTATNTFGSNSIVKKITVISTPTPLFTYKVNNFNVDFTNTTVESASWLWKFGNGKTSTIKNPSHVYANNGSFNVQLTATNTCGVRTISKLIPVFVSTPAATFSIDATKGCAPFTVKTNNLSSNAQSYLWKLEGSITPTSTDKNPNITYDKSGLYDIMLIAFNGSLADTFVQKSIVIVNDKPLVAFKSVISLDNGQVTFENKTQKADSIFWNFGDNNFSKDSLPSHFYTKSGRYIVTLVAKNECGAQSINDTIDILLPPIAKFKVDSAYTNCNEVKITLKNTSSDDTNSFLWKMAFATPDSSSMKEPTITYNKSGIYDIKLYAKNASGIDSFSQKINVTVKEKPIAFFSDSVFLNTIWLKNLSKNGLKYDWDFGDGTTSQAFETQHQFTKDAIYSIILRVVNDCDTNIFTKLVRIVTLPSAAFSQNASGKCTPVNVDFKQEASANAEQFYWYFEGGKPSVSNEPNPKVLYSTPGIYSVSLVVKNLAGSDSIFKKEIIEVKAQPKAVFIANVQGAKVVFKNISTDASSYLWTFGDGVNSTETSPTHLYKNAGTYDVQLSAKNDCGSDSSITTLMLNFVTSKDVDDIGEISVSPNPTTGYFTLSIKNLKANIVQLNLSNILGQNIDKQILNSNHEQITYSFDLSSFPKGLYFLEIKSNQNRQVVKIIFE